MMSLQGQSNAKQSGLTLIEVLVVLVILIIGILSIVGLFPTGFSVLHGGQNASAADRLAQQVLDQTVANNGANMPDGVFPTAITATGTVYDPTVSPNNLNTINVANVQPESDVDTTRYVQNEKFTVPSANPVHVLNFAPIVVTNATNPTNDITVNSLPWTSIAGNSAPDPTELDPTTQVYAPVDHPNDTLVSGTSKYMIDYTRGYLAVAPEPYEQHFTFTATQVGQTNPETVFITVPSTTDTPAYDGTQWFNLAGAIEDPKTNIQAPLNGPWVPGSASLFRPIFFKANGTFDQDPYEYSFVAPGGTPAPTLPSNFNVGALQFNPVISSQPASQALQVSVSYTAFSWHVLHEDHDVPTSLQLNSPNNPASSASSTVRLAINDLKTIGDVQQDGSVFSGIVPGAGATPYELMFVDLDTGTLANYTSVDLTDDDAQTGTGSIHISPKNGRITFPIPFYDEGANVAGMVTPPHQIQHVRVFYEGKADWAVALQRAPARYVSVTQINPVYTQTAFSTPTALSTAVTPYAGFTPNLFYYDPTKAIVYFPFCDEGKSMSLNNVVVTVGSAPNTASQTISAMTVAPKSTTVSAGGSFISTNLTQTPEVQAAVQQLSKQLGTTAATPTITLGAVAGASARAVVVWRENNHWREHTLDTLLSNT